MSELGDSKWELPVSVAGPVPAAGDRLGFSSEFGEIITAAAVQEFPAREAEHPSAAGSVHANLPQAEPKAGGQHPGSSNCLDVSSTAPASALQENLSFPSSPHAFGDLFMLYLVLI